MKWLPGQLRESARSVHKCFPTLTHSNCESVPATYVARSRNPGEVRLAGHVSPPRLAKRVGSALSDCHPTRSNTASTSTQGCLVTWPSLSSHATRSAGCVPPKKRLVSPLELACRPRPGCNPCRFEPSALCTREACCQEVSSNMPSKTGAEGTSSARPGGRNAKPVGSDGPFACVTPLVSARQAPCELPSALQGSRPLAPKPT